jgi:DUF971 family protein
MAKQAALRPWPVELRLTKGKDALEVAFDTSERFSLSAEYLRVNSRSAEVKGHGAAPAPTVFGKGQVKISALEPIGNYAVRITFDDGHDTGLYSWDHLYELGSEHGTKWPAYLEELAAQGLKRE